MSKRSIGLLSVIMLISLITVACGQPQYEPHPINEETDRCAICNMAIKDDQFATQIITTDGQPFKFDDIGCMFEWMDRNGTETIGIAFVRDYDSKAWLKLEEAYYVYDASFKTPMAYGVLSFESEEKALAYIDEQGTGTLIRAEDLASHSWEINRDMMNMDGHSHGDHEHGDHSMESGEQAGEPADDGHAAVEGHEA